VGLVVTSYSTKKELDGSIKFARLDNRPISMTVDEYVNTRLNDQIEKYYKPKGREKAIRAGKLHKLEFFLGAMPSCSALWRALPRLQGSLLFHPLVLGWQW
jgi:hypothetical protein